VALAVAVTAPLWVIGSSGQVLAQVALNLPAADVAPAPVPTLPPTTGPAATNPSGMMDRAVDSGAQIYVDDSFAAMDKLRDAMRVDSQKQSQLAIQKYQAIIDEFGQKLIYMNNDSYVSLTDFVRQRLLAIPAVQKGVYDQFFGPQARKLVDAALEAHDLGALLQACDRYFPSAAALDGMNQAAAWYFERGEFASAARVWRSLLSHPRIGEAAAGPLHHAALALHLAGMEDASTVLRDRLARDFPDASGIVDGQSVNLLDSLDSLRKLPAWGQVAQPVDEWPAFQGGPTRSTLRNVDSSASARLWSQPFAALTSSGSDNPSSGVQPGVIMNGRVAFRSGYATSANVGSAYDSYPVLSGGVIYLNANSHVLALNANAGTPLWTYPRDATPTGDSQAYMGDMYGGQMHIPDHNSCTVFDDQVFAILPAPNPPNPAGGMTYYGPYGPQHNSRVVALDRRTGAERWSCAASSLPINVKGMLTFIGAPLATRQGVFAVARKSGGDAFTQLYMVRLDRQTGKPNWSCYLCSASAGGYYGFTAASMALPIPMLIDDVVYVSTGQGADCAVDANAGRILWLQITEMARAQTSPTQMMGRSVEVIPSWKINPPIAWRDQVITFENGSIIRCYDRTSGHLTQRFNPKDLSNATVLAGVVGDTLITVGAKIHGTDLLTGKPVWEPVALPGGRSGSVVARPYLTERYLYLPTEKALVTVDIKTGEAPVVTPWPKLQGPDNKEVAGRAGNLLITSEQVVVVSDSDIAGYSRWETARDKRLAAIAKNPSDPRPYLDLGEVAFRTAHLELAHQNMQKAVDLALAQHTPDTDLIERLYRMNLSFAEQLLARTETSERDESRFYYTLCKSTARGPEANVEWRLLMANLSLEQKQFDEAATLYNDVLADGALRDATFHHGVGVSRANLAAESRLRELIRIQGAAALTEAGTPTPWTPAQIDQAGRQFAYKRLEERAQADLARAQAQKDTSLLRAVMEAYPNSQAALRAAIDMAASARAQAKYPAQMEALRWAYARAADPSQLAQISADIAESCASLRRYAAALAWVDRGLRHRGDLTWQEAGATIGFAQLRQRLTALAPDLADARAPHLAIVTIKSGERPPAPELVANGAALLTPLEASRPLRRPDLATTYDATTGKLSFVSMPDLKVKSTCQLPNPGAALLLGYHGGNAILATPAGAVAIAVDTGAVAWQIPFDLSAEDRGREDNKLQTLRNTRMQPRNGQFRQNMGNAIDPETGQPMMLVLPDAEQARTMQFQQALGQPGFSTLRILGNRLVALSGHELRAFDLTSAKPVWFPVNLPEDGAAVAVVGNEDTLVAQVDSPTKATPTFVIVDAATGRRQRTLTLDDDRVYWRALGDDGALYFVGDTAAGAYDLAGDTPRPRWRREDVRSPNPSASLLTLDGLVTVDANSDLICLSQDTGEPRWPHGRRLNSASPTGVSYLLTTLDGDNINVLSATELAAYRSSDGSDAWQSALRDMRDKPPLQNAQISDPYVVVFASGQNRTTQRAVNFFIINRVNPRTGEFDNGRLEASPQIKSRSEGDPEGPVIQHWQVVDGGIVMEINNRVYLYHPAKLGEAGH
jgi:outer membrane protein assembly factor BamB